MAQSSLINDGQNTGGQEVENGDDGRISRTDKIGDAEGGIENRHVNGSSGPTGKAEQQTSTGVAPPKPAKMKQLWAKVGLDVVTILMMFKGSVAPLIGIAFYQSSAVAKEYNTIGYLVPIVTFLAVPIMPRAKFLQTLFLNIVASCLGCAISILGIWSSIQARFHTSSPPHLGYNSSQAVICGIWLLFTTWIANTLRAKIPAMQFPVIICSIFTNVAFAYGPIFPTVASELRFIKTLLVAFLTAFAISLGVNLFIIPVSSRTVVFKEQAGYLGLIRKTLKSEVAYLQSLETSDMFKVGSESNTGEQNANHSRIEDKQKKKKESGTSRAQTPEAATLKANITALLALQGKLSGDLAFAKLEFAYGKLCAKDIDEISKKLRLILLPLIGISTITDIFERIAERRGWVQCGQTHQDRSEAWEHVNESLKDEEKRTWNEIMKALHEPFAVAAAAMDEALEHIGIVLELTPAPKKSKSSDVEAEAGEVKPGHRDFTKQLKDRMTEFYRGRGAAIKAWAQQKGITQADFDSNELPADPSTWTAHEAQHRRDQQQLYLILYLEHLLFSAGLAVGELADFADSKVADGTMSKKRMILPGQRRLQKWMMSIGKEDQNIDTQTPDSLEANTHNVYLGSGFMEKKDPEHLPATNWWEKFGNGVRAIPRFLGSTESAFGFRVGLATLTIGILAFLRETQQFFVQNRLVWAMIIIAIGMSMTSGQSIFGFVCRIAGTVLAMVSSIVIWYIVDERTWGVIIFLWFSIFLEMYFFIKMPRFIQVFLVMIVTQILIVGYEIQTHKIGVEASESSGQRYLPVYELAPYRLACVAGGSFVAFFWTLFPYPITDRSWFRKDLGSTLYLLANYYSVVHSTIKTRLHHTEGDLNSKHSPGRKLDKARLKVFSKLLMLLPSLTMHAEWQKYELSIGGKFPRETYEKILLRTHNIMSYLTLMAFATRSLGADYNDGVDPSITPDTGAKWLGDLTALTDKLAPTSHQITSTLSLLSASVRNGSALPPYMQLPEPYNLSRKLEQLDRGILSVKHIEEPGYSAYAVMQVASSMLGDDLVRLVEHVKELVGETSFEFSGINSVDDLGKGGRDGKGKQE